MGKFRRSARNLEREDWSVALPSPCPSSRVCHCRPVNLFDKFVRLSLYFFQADRGSLPTTTRITCCLLIVCLNHNHRPHLWGPGALLYSRIFGDELCTENVANHHQGVIVIFSGGYDWHGPNHR